MTQPLLARLKREGHELTVAALPWVAPVYEAMAECDHVMVLPFARGKLEFQQRRRWSEGIKGQFDCAYVCPNSFKSALLVCWADIDWRVGYLGEMRWGLLNHRLPNPSKSSRASMVHFYLAMADAGPGPLHEPGLSPELKAPQDLDSQSPQPRLTMDPQAVNDGLASFNLSSKAYVAMAPGAEYGDAKRWPQERFCELIAKIELPVVLLGSGSDRVLCEEMVQELRSKGHTHVQNLAGQTTLKEAMSLIAAAKGLVSNDSGLMHVAAALGVEQVALFGSSSPEHTPALSPHAQMIWLKWDPDYRPVLDCAPCFERTCALSHKRCLGDISAQRVEALMQKW